MADNDDYMVAKAYNDTVTELMWDRLQEAVNANRRFRLRGVAGGNNMRYSSTKVVWDSDIYIYFTRESDGAWVYNKINTNPTTGITCGDDDLLYVTLNDTTATVLTVTAADYTSMLTDDTGRVLILGAVRGSRWYGTSSTDISHDSILDVSIDDHHARDHDNTEHSTNYEAANANIQSHVGGTPPVDSHHTKYVLTDDFSTQEITQLQAIGETTTISAGQWGIVGGLVAIGSGTIISTAERTALHAESHTHDSHSGVLSANEGGTGQSAYVIGDILYANTTTTLAALAATTDTYVLTLVSSVPAWVAQGAPGAHASTHEPGGADIIGYLELDTDTSDPASTTKIQVGAAIAYGGADYVLKVQSDDGYWLMGAGNTSWIHADTDRAGFFFFKKIVFYGTEGIYFDGAATYGISHTGTNMIITPEAYLEVKSTGDTYGLIIRDAGSADYGNLKNVDGVTYLGDGTGTNADMIAIGGTTVTFPGIVNYYLSSVPVGYVQDGNWWFGSTFTSHAEIAGMKIHVDIGGTAGSNSMRLMFTEYPDTYGVSLLYAGEANPTLGGVNFTLPANRWHFINHSNSTTGSVVFYVDRASTNVYFNGDICSGTDVDHRIVMDPAANSIHIYPGDAAGNRYVQIISTGADAISPMIQPNVDQCGYVGQSTNEWNRMYAVAIYRNGTALDSFDDLAIIDGVTVMKDAQDKPVLNEHGNPYLDPNSLPDFLRPSLEERVEGKAHVELGAWADLAIGAVKQLHGKHQDLEQVVVQQSVKIIELENEIDILKGIN